MAQLQQSTPSLVTIIDGAADHPVPQQSISFLAANNMPITLPWSPGMLPLSPGVLFHSRLCERQDPWGKASPWDHQSMRSAKLTYRLDDGGHASFHSVETTNSNTSDDHLTVSFGVTAGCSFLNASVAGAYDRGMKENRDERKLSIKASYRAGSITLQSRPALSLDALVVLKHQGGIAAFKYLYGDYYVAGYRLGGDAAVALSESAFTTSALENLSVKISAEVLFAKSSKTHAKFFRSSDASSGFRVSGFDTLTQTLVATQNPVSVYSAGSSVDSESAMEELAMQANALEKLCVQLPRRVSQQIQNAGLDRGQEVSWERLQGIMEGQGVSGLVVEMILLPITSLRPVLEWALSADVIGSCA